MELSSNYETVLAATTRREEKTNWGEAGSSPARAATILDGDQEANKRAHK